MATQMQILPEFVVQTRKYILINSDSRPIMAKAAGISINIPSRDEVVEVDKENPTGFFSAKDLDGTYIPGTVVVQDRYKIDHEGNDVLVVDASLIVRHLLGINNKQGMATGIHAHRGLSLLRAGSTREELEALREQGMKRSEKWRVEQARFIVAEFDNANAKRERAKQPPLTPDDDYTQALLLLRAARGKDQERLAAMLSGPDVTGDKRLMASIREDVEVDDADALLELLKEKARQVLPDDAPPADMSKLVNMIINSKEGMQLLRQQFKMKKHAKRARAAAGKPDPDQITDQAELEKVHGRPKPVNVEKKEAALSQEDKDALLADAHRQGDKGAMVEIVGDPQG